MTSIIDIQRRDHAHMNSMIDDYEQATSNRAAIFRSLTDLVTTHAFAEETVLFPAARRALGRRGDDITGTIEAEHQKVNELLAGMNGHEPGDARFDEATLPLFAILRNDARQEEDVLLVELASAASADELRAIGAEWRALKAVAPNRAHPGIPRRPPGNLLAALPLTVLDHVRDLRARLTGRSQ